MRSATVALLVAMVGFAAPSPASADIVPIQLLTINDFHGRIDENTLKFAGTVAQLRTAVPADNTLVVGAGDFIGASVFASSSQQDDPTIDVMNEIGVDVSAVGNHEFDQGFADLTDRVVPRADWDYLGANVYLKGTTTPALPEFGIYTVGGFDVGVIGVVTQETPTLVSPSGVASLDFGDPVEAINRVAEQLSDGNPANGEADILVATLHEGAPEGEEAGGTLENQIAASPVFAHIVSDTSATVDAIVNGHTHQAYAFNAPVPGVAGKTRPIIQTGLYGANVGQIMLSVDSVTNEVVGSTVHNVPRTTVADANLLQTFPALSPVNTTVLEALAAAEEIGGEAIGSVAADITTAFSGGSYVNGIYAGGTRDDRAGESTLGNEVANAMVATLSDPDRGGATIGVVNPGGLRAELLFAPDGVITFAEANGVLPFVNNLWTFDLTGAQFVTVLEQQWQTAAAGDPPPTRAYLQLGLSNNVSYTYDPTAAQDHHITSVTIDGSPLDVDATYRVGTFSFLAEGGDNFREFANATNVRDSGLIDSDAWIDYLRNNPNLAPDFARHSAAITGTGVIPGAGGTATLQVSALDLTSLGAPANTTLSVQAVPVPVEGGSATDLGSFPVTNGAASVSFTVPAIGVYELRMTASPTNTVITIPLVVVADQTTSTSTTPTTSASTQTTASTTRTTATKGSSLSSTGISPEASSGTTLVATALILLGVVIVVLARRRQPTGDRRH